MEEMSREEIEMMETMSTVKTTSYVALGMSLIFTVIAIIAIPGPWASKSDDLQQFTLSGYCFRASTTAEFACVGYNGFSLPGSNVTFAEATPEAVSVAFGMSVVQVAFNVATLFVLAFFVLSLGGHAQPLGNVVLAKIATLTATLAFIFGLVAMLAIAGDKSFQNLIWESALTKDQWSWGAGYLLNIVAWVGALLLTCLVFAVWTFATPEEDEEEDDKE